MALKARFRCGKQLSVAVSATSKCRGLIPRLLSYLEVLLTRDLSIFVDESGDGGGVGPFKKNWLKQTRRKRID